MGKQVFDINPTGRAISVTGGAETLADGTTGIKGGRFVCLKAGGNDGEYVLAAEGGSAEALLPYDATNTKPAALYLPVGSFPVLADEAITMGAELSVGASGGAKLAVDDAARIGVAEEAASGAGVTFVAKFYGKLQDTVGP